MGPLVSAHSPLKPQIQSAMSLERAYTMFRNMGLRHLLVVDEHNRVQGIVTNTGSGCRNVARLAAGRAA